jgi:hypothetical protein
MLKDIQWLTAQDRVNFQSDTRLLLPHCADGLYADEVAYIRVEQGMILLHHLLSRVVEQVYLAGAHERIILRVLLKPVSLPHAQSTLVCTNKQRGQSQ